MTELQCNNCKKIFVSKHNLNKHLNKTIPCLPVDKKNKKPDSSKNMLDLERELQEIKLKVKKADDILLEKKQELHKLQTSGIKYKSQHIYIKTMNIFNNDNKIIFNFCDKIGNSITLNFTDKKIIKPTTYKDLEYEITVNNVFYFIYITTCNIMGEIEDNIIEKVLIDNVKNFEQITKKYHEENPQKVK